jgi:molybdate transport system substrate-binding protein
MRTRRVQVDQRVVEKAIDSLQLPKLDLHSGSSGTSPQISARIANRSVESTITTTRLAAIKRLIFLALVISAFFSLPNAAQTDELRVATSGAFTAAYLKLVPTFEKISRTKVVTAFGASMGNTHDAIPNRLNRGESIDVVILAAPALEDLIRKGKVEADSRRDLVQSIIGMVVRSGETKPDISTVAALKQTLLKAKSIAYSDSASGVYISTEMFQHLGIATEILNKSRKIEGEPVASAVARGEAQIGFQQISELLSVSGVDYVGPLPSEVQKVTTFSAGITVGALHPQAARQLIDFLGSPACASVIKKSGLEPIHQNR